MRPVILLDVDGPLNPYNAKMPLRGYKTYEMEPKLHDTTVHVKVALNPAHGPALMATGAEIVWASTWEEQANEWIAPRIGLPSIDWIDWTHKDHHRGGKLFWKTHRIWKWMEEFRPGQPFMWIDDELTRLDTKELQFHCGDLANTLKIDPKLGLQPSDFEYLRDWSTKNGVYGY